MINAFRNLFCPFNFIMILIFRVSSDSPVPVHSPISIVDTSQYRQVPTCVQNCLYEDYDALDFLPCSPDVNVCFCRLNLASSVSSFLTSCVNDHCSSRKTDVFHALSIYDEYCASKINEVIFTVTTTATNAKSKTEWSAPGVSFCYSILMIIIAVCSLLFLTFCH